MGGGGGGRERRVEGMRGAGGYRGKGMRGLGVRGGKGRGGHDSGMRRCGPATRLFVCSVIRNRRRYVLLSLPL